MRFLKKSYTCSRDALRNGHQFILKVATHPVSLTLTSSPRDKCPFVHLLFTLKYHIFKRHLSCFMVAHNDQPSHGSKHELVQRCFDCYLRGSIPRCKKCGGHIEYVVVSVVFDHNSAVLKRSGTQCVAFQRFIYRDNLSSPAFITPSPNVCRVPKE